MSLDRLFEHPIAHRGLHDAAAGIVENSRSAVLRAIEAGYAFEVDVQITSDGNAVVFHDDVLDRLTDETGPVNARTAAELVGIPLKGNAQGDRIWTLAELLALVAGRVPAIIEIKTLWDGDRRLALRTGQLLSSYRGAAGAKSFDPDMVEALRNAAPDVLRGIVGYAYDDEEAQALSAYKRFRLRNLLHWAHTKPDFISWGVRDLPRRSVDLANRLTGAPVMTWTVRSPADQARAGLYADQMIFEGFLA
jgi:glycerophosphoryl diester phosphodiesterase